MGEVTIKFWGRLSDLMGPKAQYSLQEPTSVEHLRKALAETYAEGDVDVFQTSIRAIVNDAIAHEDTLVKPGDTLEFLPPVGGG